MQLHLPKNTYFAKSDDNLIDASMLLDRANCTNKLCSITDKPEAHILCPHDVEKGWYKKVYSAGH